MLLLIRGHIRNGFDTEDLCNFVRILYSLYKVDIYIQTWSVFSNNISWRPVATNSTQVTEDIIKNYFKDIPIKSILILDDATITITGNKTGGVAVSCVPIIGWKNMWYGKAALANHVANQESPETLLINTRFDLFSNLNNQTLNELLPFIKTNYEIIPKNLIFRCNRATGGIDNFYMTTVAINQRTSHHFHTNLDEIIKLSEYRNIAHPEYLVFFENKRLYN